MTAAQQHHSSRALAAMPVLRRLLLLLCPPLVFCSLVPALPGQDGQFADTEIPPPKSVSSFQGTYPKSLEYGQQMAPFSAELLPTSEGDGRPAGVYDTNLENNMTRILNALIASHDRRIRPDFGGEPTLVNVTAHVITISAISEVSMDYTVDLYLRQFWRDRRLAFQAIKGHDNLTVGIDMVKSIWTPDTFFPNEKKSYFHETTSHNSFLRIDSNGNVIRSIRLTVTANCPMSLHTFPLDVQICALEIESYGYSTSDIIYHWHPEKPVTIDDDVHLAHFSIGGHYQVERTISLSTGNYSRLTAYFTFKRNLGFYLIQIYFPSSLIVVISWVSFFLNREATQARVTIGVTTVLTQTTLMTSTNASLPKVSYVKSLDIFLGVCFFIVFASLLEYAAVGFLMKRQRQKVSSTSGGGEAVARPSMVYFQEMEDGTVRMNNPPRASSPHSHENNCSAPAAAREPSPGGVQRKCAQQLRRPLTLHMRKHDSLTSNGGPEHVAPLLSLSPLPRSSVPTTFVQASANHLLTSRSMSFFVPEPESVRFSLAMASAAEDLSKRGCWWKVRPCQVDLFSRIAFPLFFVIFHLVYWSFHLAYLNFE